MGSGSQLPPPLKRIHPLISCVHLPRQLLVSVLQRVNAVLLHNVNVLADDLMHPPFNIEGILWPKYLHPSDFLYDP